MCWIHSFFFFPWAFPWDILNWTFQVSQKGNKTRLRSQNNHHERQHRSRETALLLVFFLLASFYLHLGGEQRNFCSLLCWFGARAPCRGLQPHRNFRLGSFKHFDLDLSRWIKAVSFLTSIGGFWCSESSLAELFLPSLRGDSHCIFFPFFCFFPPLSSYKRQLYNSTEAESGLLTQQGSSKPPLWNKWHLHGKKDESPWKEESRGFIPCKSGVIQQQKAAGEAKTQTTQHWGWALNQKPPFPPNPCSFSFWTGFTSSLFFHWKWEEIWLHMIHK